MSIFKGIKPVDATHHWYGQDGSWRGWLRIDDWVSIHQDPQGWVVIAKSVKSLAGKVVKL